jgi:hypothetical protein
MLKKWVIYSLEDPRGGGVRYVGITHQEPQKRLRGHLSKARRGARSHLFNWIRKLQADGVEPILRVLESGSGEGWGAAETQWIAWHRTLGCDLTNATDGGEGCPGHKVSLEARQKMREARLGKPLSPEHKAKVAAGNRGKKMRPESIALGVEKRCGFKHTAEARAKISAARKGKAGWIPTPDVLAKRARAIQAAMSNKRAAGGTFSPDAATRAKISQANKGLKRSPETRARMSAARKAVCAKERERTGKQLGERASHKTCPICGLHMHRQSKTCRSCFEKAKTHCC